MSQPVERYWRLLELVEDMYTSGVRRAGDDGAAVAAAAAVAARLAQSGVGQAGEDGPAGEDRQAGEDGQARAVGQGGEVARPAVDSAVRGRAPTPGAPPSVSARQPTTARTPAAPGGAADPSADSSVPDSLQQVASEVAACRACGLCEQRTKTVPGEGAERPLVMVIGEGPGRDEDVSGRPFVGRAGRYLDRWLKAVHLDRRDNCFITNAVKCRPPGNRDPLPEESAACQPYLQRQIRLLRPQAILSVGRIAGQLLTGRAVSMGQLRGQVYSYQVPGMQTPIPLVATYHPSGVLRNTQLRVPVWEDLRLLARLIADVRTDRVGTGTPTAGAAPAGDTAPTSAAADGDGAPPVAGAPAPAPRD